MTTPQQLPFSTLCLQVASADEIAADSACQALTSAHRVLEQQRPELVLINSILTDWFGSLTGA